MTDLSVRRGDDQRLDLAIVDATGAPFDLTGAFLWLTAKRNRSDADSDAVLRKTSDDGITVDGDPTLGLAAIQLDAADTADFPAYAHSYPFDVQLLDGAGQTTTVVDGILTITPDVTRASDAPS